ncbi:hypothetical protein H9L17_04840 [Thermomonas brevis]|uniref:DUF1311 domain-containing protein n=1 Tax=Thermomonas brevis TaxID=215691 RepID=A0A7G9QVU2_9GAMM|nr:hypothetical protein [Thermomonas brevis]QNN47467.1 hypothetical protein H9L17_04840 [Thermomonas brevis]
MKFAGRRVEKSRTAYLHIMLVALICIAAAPTHAQEKPKQGADISRATDAVMRDYEDAAKNDIRRFCSMEWPEDFSMQKHCVEEQTEARDKAQKIDITASQVAMKIWGHCTSEWTDKTTDLTDWAMMYHCYEEQMSAYHSLNP